MTAGEVTAAPVSRGAGPSLVCHLRLMACGEDRHWDVNLGAGVLSAQPTCGDLRWFTYIQTPDGGGACVAALGQSHEAAGGEEPEAEFDRERVGGVTV